MGAQKTRGAPRNVPLLTAVVATTVAVVLALVHHFAFDVGGLPGMAALEGFSIDARFRLRGPRAIASDRIVIVGLDDFHAPDGDDGSGP